MAVWPSLPQRLLGELWQDERCLMQLLRVVLEEFILFLTAHEPRRFPHIPVRIFATYHEAHLAAWVGRNGGPRVVSDWEDALALFLERLDDVHMQPWVLACCTTHQHIHAV